MITSRPPQRGLAAVLRPLVSLLIFSSALATAQEVRPRTAAEEMTTGSSPSDGKALEMSMFEVSTTEDKGYVTTNATTGFKTNQSLLSIPQAITVVTRDLIDDIGYAQSSDALQFAGGARNTVGAEGVMLRGSRIDNPWVDEFPNGGPPYLDNANIDSYELIRGPAAVFYVQASLGGIVLKTTRKPLPYRSGYAMVRADEHGGYRGEFDSTGPLVSLGEGKFSYRVTGAYHGGTSFFRNIENDMKAIFPVFQFKHKDLTVRLAGDYTRTTHYAQAMSPLTPDGQVYTGAGRDENYQPKNNGIYYTASQVRLSILQRIGENWEAKFSAAGNLYHSVGGTILPSGGVDWINNTMTFTARRNDQKFHNYFALGDVTGKYDLFSLKSQTTAGFQFGDYKSYAGFWASPTFGVNGRLTVPINRPNMDSVIVPRGEDYLRPANPGNLSYRNSSNIYIQQQTDIIRDRLSLVVGGSRWDNKNTSIPNVDAPAPRPSSITVSNDWLHRYGIVLHLTKEISAYALDSTVVLPSTNGRQLDGTLLPNLVGKGKEVGIKTALFGGRVSSTISVFDIRLTNQSSLGGILPSGENWFRLIGETTQKGWDFDLAISPIPGWQLVAAGYWGEVKDPTGGPVSLSYKSSQSMFTRYDFNGGALRGLSVGGGAARVGGRVVSSSGLILPTNQARPFITLKEGTQVNLFASYRLNKHWTLRLNVENVLDDVYPAGLQAAWLVDPSLPRTFSIAATFKL